MRSVESGFAMARASRNGLLTLSDAHGRIVAEMPSSVVPGFMALIGNIAAGTGRATLYDRIGDLFGWACVALSLGLLLLALFRHRMIQSPP